MKTFVMLLVASATIYQLTAVVVLAFSSPHSKAISHSPLRRTTASSASILYESKSKASTLTSSSSADPTSSSSTTRPLHQNWFPVSITTALRPDRPNAIQLLSQKLVLYRDGDDTWVCLADRCSHRFAPLSEGRLISSRSSESNSSSSGGGSVDDKSSCASCSSIQCAYHGWQFDSTGNCITVPQSPSSSASSTKAKPIPTFPCREESGMIWVWGDSNPTTFDMAKSIPLPISPLVQRAYSNYGADACFMRDLPYGCELLGENLLDLSHLPFSHHNVGGLNRELGGELVLRMMSEKERVAYALWEEEFVDDDNGGGGGEDDQDDKGIKKKRYSVPMHQAEVMNARHTDPMFLTMAERFPVSENANSTISFYEPCHIRYRRERVPGTFGHVELFMCPTSAGKSRVFLWNTIYKPPEETVSTAAASLKSRLAKLSPLSAIKRVMLAKLFNPATARAHILSHSIFDGDGIFLNYQGNRMYENGLTFRDYSTPSSADVLLNAYRRYLDSAAKLSTKAAAKAVSYQSNDAYGDDDITRSMMLDRYNSHTKHCAVCQKELFRYEKKRGAVAILKTALVGAGGASTAALVGTLFVGLPAAVARAAAISTVTSTLGFTALSRKETALERKIQSFKFEDYIHAEKN